MLIEFGLVVDRKFGAGNPAGVVKKLVGSVTIFCTDGIGDEPPPLPDDGDELLATGVLEAMFRLIVGPFRTRPKVCVLAGFGPEEVAADERAKASAKDA